MGITCGPMGRKLSERVPFRAYQIWRMRQVQAEHLPPLVAAPPRRPSGRSGLDAQRRAAPVTRRAAAATPCDRFSLPSSSGKENSQCVEGRKRDELSCGPTMQLTDHAKTNRRAAFLFPQWRDLPGGHAMPWRPARGGAWHAMPQGMKPLLRLSVDLRSSSEPVALMSRWAVYNGPCLRHRFRSA